MTQVVINSFPAEISSDPFEVAITIIGAKSAKNYLRVELYKDGTKNYFGETFNGNTWYGGTDGLFYSPVDIAGPKTEATIKARLGDPDVADYQGKGNYKLKVKRYTASGNPASDDVKEVDVAITYHKETPTPVPTQTPQITLAPSPSSTFTPSPSPVAIVLADKTLSPTQILSTAPQKQAQEPFPFFPALIFATGLFLTGISIYLVVKKRLTNYNVKNVSGSKNH